MSNSRKEGFLKVFSFFKSLLGIIVLGNEPNCTTFDNFNNFASLLIRLRKNECSGHIINIVHLEAQSRRFVLTPPIKLKMVWSSDRS